MEEDFAAIREIAWRSWEAAYGAFVPEADRAAFFAEYYTADGHRRACRSERTLYLVAEDETGPAAFLLASRGPEATSLHRLYADPRRWRGGGGQLLWDELLRWSRAAGATRVTFEVATEGCPGPRFYRKQGCRPVDESVMPVGRTPVRVTRYAYDLVSREAPTR